MKSSSAAVLTVGTEITSGEILNSNSKWIAEQLETLGFEVTLHLSVPDDRPLIQDALNFSSRYSDLLLITGGLGPTSDDFTRDVIANWATSPLVFNDQVWKELGELYIRRNLTLRQAHRQQCHFPKTATLLPNIVGTAHGFYLKHKDKHLIVLPGPPREILAMWEPSVEPVLKSLNPKASAQLYRWICFGAAESEVAELVEKIIQGKNLKVGYRASKPFVHVKIWVPMGADASQLVLEVSQTLAHWQVHDGKEREDG